MKWSIGTKIGAGFFFCVLVLALVGVMTYSNTRAFVKAANERKKSHEVLKAVQALLLAVTDAETGQRGFLITGQERYLEPCVAARQNIFGMLGTLRKLTDDNSVLRTQLAPLQQDIDAKLAEIQETIATRRDQGFEAAVAIVLSDKGKQAMDDVRRVIGEMQREEEALLEQRSREADRQATATLGTIIYGIPAAAAVIFLTGYGLALSIARPLREVTEIADRIATGDLSGDIAITRRTDEVGLLGNAFGRMNLSLRKMSEVARQIAAGNLLVEAQPQSEKDLLGNSLAKMTKELRGFMQEILEAVNILATSASEIMASTSELAAGAAQTATAMTETTATVEEVKQTAQVSSEKGKIVAESSQKTSDIAQSGKRSAEETVNGMARIRAQMDSIAERIVRLSEQSQAIGEIISVVDDLAAQSNLLAVNASIEAAKAGEHGRGFAVVAQEVKNLANQSKQATTQVRAILSEIQKATSGAVMATEQGSKAVEEGVRQSKTAGDAIAALSESIFSASQTATQIAATSQEQFVGMDQVALAMENIKLASTQTVASTRQVETAAQNLHDLGQRLKDMAARFQV